MQIELIEALKHLDMVARSHGINNIFQPGLAKEAVVAYTLGHALLPKKHGPDARTSDGKVCEYLSCWEGGAGQLDRMLKSPEEKR